MGIVPPFEKNRIQHIRRDKLSGDHTELVPHIQLIRRHPLCQRSMDSHLGCVQLIEEYGDDSSNEIFY